jgi:hypothetical protein
MKNTTHAAENKNKKKEEEFRPEPYLYHSRTQSNITFYAAQLSLQHVPY